MMNSTATRVPRTTGLPPRTLGSTVILSCQVLMLRFWATFARQSIEGVRPEARGRSRLRHKPPSSAPNLSAIAAIHQGADALALIAFFDAGIEGILDHQLKFVPTMPQSLPSRRSVAFAVLVSAKPTQCQSEFLDRQVRAAFPIDR